MGGRVREGRVKGGRVPFKYFPSHCWNAEVMATVEAMGCHIVDREADREQRQFLVWLLR